MADPVNKGLKMMTSRSSSELEGGVGLVVASVSTVVVALIDDLLVVVVGKVMSGVSLVVDLVVVRNGVVAFERIIKQAFKFAFLKLTKTTNVLFNSVELKWLKFCLVCFNQTIYNSDLE